VSISFGVRDSRLVWQHTVIGKDDPWRTVDHVEFETLKWVDWFNNRRLLGPIGYVPPAEYEEMYYQEQEMPAMVAGLTQKGFRGTWGIHRQGLTFLHSTLPQFTA